MPVNAWTIPNAISSFRLIAGPLFIYFLLLESALAVWVCLILMILAELSDFLDGYIARATNTVSSLGKILDPMSDSFYRISVFVGFVAKGWMPVWMFLIILSRDIIVSYLRIMAEQKIGTLSARASGKWKAVFQSVAQIGIVVLYALTGGALEGVWMQISYGLLLAATLMTAYSLFDYSAAVLSKLK